MFRNVPIIRTNLTLGLLLDSFLVGCNNINKRDILKDMNKHLSIKVLTVTGLDFGV